MTKIEANNSGYITTPPSLNTLIKFIEIFSCN
jgi:hypothetical protein